MNPTFDSMMKAMGFKRVKTRRCKVCKTPFQPRNSFHVLCGSACAIALAEKSEQKKKRAEDSQRKKEKAAERKADKAKKDKLKTRSAWVREAQAAVNQFRRLEELAKGRGCISCGRSQAEVIGTDGWKPGGAFDAGHFVSVGANCSLRFEPKNIWLQCKSCNAGSGKYAKKSAVVSKAYRANLIEREGIELVEWLEGPHEMKNYTIEELKSIRDTYRVKTRLLIEESKNGKPAAGI